MLSVLHPHSWTLAIPGYVCARHLATDATPECQEKEVILEGKVSFLTLLSIVGSEMSKHALTRKSK